MHVLYLNVRLPTRKIHSSDFSNGVSLKMRDADFMLSHIPVCSMNGMYCMGAGNGTRAVLFVWGLYQLVGFCDQLIYFIRLTR